jgi:SOS response regulatory protein OraA/RecX
MNTAKQLGFRPGSKPDWRKRLTSVTRYIDDLEYCLELANAAISARDYTIQELRRYIQYQNEINRGGRNECC